jgi:hypothetical protein
MIATKFRNLSVVEGVRKEEGQGSIVFKYIYHVILHMGYICP